MVILALPWVKSRPLGGVIGPLEDLHTKDQALQQRNVLILLIVAWEAARRTWV